MGDIDRIVASEACLRPDAPWLYNQQLPQSALGNKPPLQAMTDWHNLERTCSEAAMRLAGDVRIVVKTAITARHTS